MNGNLAAILLSLAGGLLVLPVQYFIKALAECNSQYTGLWRDNIYNDNGVVVKSDIIKMKQRKDEVYGYIKRVSPIEQNKREWKFTGRIIEGSMIAIFWPNKQAIPSYGCWFVSLLDDNKFVGYYLRIDKNENTLRPIKIEIYRADKAKR